jgi:hypothetical protein
VKPSSVSRPTILLPVLGLVLVVVLDSVQLVRPSIVSGAACAGQLLRAKPDARAIVTQYRGTIAAEASRNDLPAELVAAVIYNHQAYMSSFRRFTDCFGSAFGANLSLGLAQLRISTAAELDGTYIENLSPSDYRSLRSRLLEPATNIAYQARELRALLERENRYPGMGAQALIHDPPVMALIITEYRMGRLKTDSRSSRLSANAFNALKLMQDEVLDLFGRDAGDSRLIRREIRDYLSRIYCESDLFNQSVCEDWRRENPV